MALFDIKDFKVLFGWVLCLLLCIAVYLYQSDQKALETRDNNIESLIKENHKSIQASLSEKEKQFKVDIKEQNTKFQLMVKNEVSAVTRQMLEFKIDQRVFVKDQKQLVFAQHKMSIDIATLKAKINLGVK